MALTYTPEQPEFGSPAIDFDLPGVDGRNWTLANARGERGTVVMFICNHCPFVKSIQQRLVDDFTQLKQFGVSAIAIMSNDPADYPEDSFDNMRLVAEQLGYPFPYVFDQTQAVAKAYGAVCTPDFFGYDKDLELRYRGRLDAAGRDDSPAGMRRDLVEAMKLVAETGQTPPDQIQSMGCSIKWASAS